LDLGFLVDGVIGRSNERFRGSKFYWILSYNISR